MDLHRTVRETAEENPDIANPGDLVPMVFDKISPEDHPEVIRTLLRSYVRDVFRTGRRSHDSRPAMPELVFNASAQGGTQVFRPSPKVAGIRETWRARLADRVFGDGVWKLLGDCSYADLKAASEERRRLAAENSAVARRYERIASAVEDHGVSTVGDLPDDVLREILG